MARTPVPPSDIKNPARRVSASWRASPGAHPSPPRAPAGLSPAGKRWWKAAWAGPTSAGWSPLDVEVVTRGAQLADRIDRTEAPASLLTELRQIEDGLGLTRIGRLRQHLLVPEDEPPPRVRPARPRRRMLAVDSDAGGPAWGEK